MNHELYVWIYPPSTLEPVSCGTLDLIGGRRCLFSYANVWLARSAFWMQVSADMLTVARLHGECSQSKPDY